jgi:peptide deformylase
MAPDETIDQDRGGGTPDASASATAERNGAGPQRTDGAAEPEQVAPKGQDGAPESADGETLDPEQLARRQAALAYVCRYGDPALKSTALEVERFDDELREEIARMGQIMSDAVGIGLAATQLGTMHRVLVYRVAPEAPIAALVNPRIEWLGSERESAEEGCLSLPGVIVEVERAIHALVRAKDGDGREILIEASGLEARVIQHEIDHLDGVLILDRTSRQERKEALRAMREREQAAAAGVAA